MEFLKYFVFILCSLLTIDAFNISPKPNLVIKEPTTGRFRPKYRSSYFGYTLLLKEKSVFVGAPRAQSSIESQRNINETGLLYKCSLETGSSGHCVVYLIDKKGNEHSEDNEHTIDSKKKDYQWLGGALDGGSTDAEPLVVCAPRMKAETSEDYLMHGVCYRTPDTIEEQPTIIKTISPLKGTTQQIWGNSFMYAFGQSGFNVHWNSDKDEILIGAPGIYDWRGSVIRYRAEEDKGLGGLQKRDIINQLKIQEKNKKYVSTVPNPSLWNQGEFSYFGYSEYTGYFNVDSKLKLLYVASAPRANNYDGEVYIYDIIIDDRTKNYNIKKYQTFSGKQFGEFFGYTVLTEDINGDGYTDIIVSAPFYTKSNIYDCGAVYLYINDGGSFLFNEQLIVCPNKKSGRFGTTISLLGDINQDGYRDIAISAPFNQNGKVYIYLGNKNGLQNEPSQIINAPNVDNTIVDNHMFGHGLSKGLDIDNNGYNDFIIGAPNAELVYLYKTYPIVKISSTIDSLNREIQKDQKILQIRVCFKMISNSESSIKTMSQDLKLLIEADLQLKRIVFNDGKRILNDILNLKSELNECKIYESNINLNLKDIFKPIEIKMTFNMVNQVPDSGDFCDKCIALDPSFENTKTHRIPFNTGCAGEICIADLNINSVAHKTFVLGSSSTISIEYKIRNDGETAYLPRLNVTSSNNMPFAKIPSMCNNYQYYLVCDLNHGQPMANGETDSITINFDAENINENSIEITGYVLSTGEEKNLNDNYAIDKIEIIEMSSVDIIRTNKNEMITLEETSGMYEFINKYEIKNNGPSLIKMATIKILIPVSYLIPKTTTRVRIISTNNVTLKANYGGYNIIPKYYQHGSILIQDSNYGGKKDNYISSVNIIENSHGSKYDHSNVGYDLEHNNNNNDMNNNYGNNDDYSMRRRRSSNIESASKNMTKTKEYSRIIIDKTANTIRHELTGTLPLSKVINFNCLELDDNECIEIILKINNFRVSNEYGINIELKYIANLDEINKALINEKEFFFIANEFNITRNDIESNESIEIPKRSHYVVVSKFRLSSTPVWVIILSVIAGLLLLALLVFGLYKMKFFVRKTPPESANLTSAAEPMLEQPSTN